MKIKLLSSIVLLKMNAQEKSRHCPFLVNTSAPSVSGSGKRSVAEAASRLGDIGANMGVPLSWGRAQWLWILVFSTWDVTQNFWTATLSISSRPSSENLTLISLSMLYRCISMYRTGLFLTPLKWMKVSVTQKMAFLALFVFNHGSWMHGWLENKNFTWQNKKLNYSLPFVFDDVHWNTKKK